MADDDDHHHHHQGSKHAPLPRCHCNWKMCRTYQRAFRDYDHETMHGVVRMKFSEYDETHRTLKEAWDNLLGTEESKKEAWKDGICKYYVARHHFTQAMITESMKSKKSWSWTEPLSKVDALQQLHKPKDEYKIGDDGGGGYMKVPDVPRKVVKELVENVKATGILRQNSISDLSVKSNLSALSSMSANKSSSKPKSKKGQLEDLLAALPSNDDDDDDEEEDAKKKKSKKASSLGPEHMHKSDSLISPKKKKSKDSLGGSSHSTKSDKGRSSNSSKNSKSKKSKSTPSKGGTPSKGSPSKGGTPSKKAKAKVTKKPEDFEGELMELVEKGSESKSQETIAALQAELFEQKSIAEAALEDLDASRREVAQLRGDIKSMQVKVGKVSAVLDDDTVEEMEKLRLSLSSTMEMHSVERESFQSKTEEQESKIKQLEEQLRKERGKTRKLEMERMKLEADKNKATGLSSRRLVFVEELEQKLLNEKTKARQLERELLDTIGAEKSKTAAALLEAGQSEMKVVALEKELEELKTQHTNGSGADNGEIGNLKKRIAELEEENAALRGGSGTAQRQPAETARALSGVDTAGSGGDSARIAELEAEVKRLTDKNRKLAIAAGGGAQSGDDITLKQAIDALEREKKALELQNTNQMKAIKALEATVSKDDLAALEQARKEDDLERATALLANLYFTKKNADLLERVAADLALPIDEEKNAEGKTPSQSELLESALQRKQARWWKTLDGFMGNSGYVKQSQMKRSSNLAE